MDAKMEACLARLRRTYRLREPVLRAMIGRSAIEEGSRGIDVGCGIGMTTLLMAERTGPSGHEVGADVSPELLEHARVGAQEVGADERVTYREASAGLLPFPDGEFDWAWSIDCVGRLSGDPVPHAREMARVVTPGGTVALAGWASQVFLPGRPGLEARLNATPAGMAPFVEGAPDGRHFLQALGWLREIGLTDPTAQTFVGTVRGPLRAEVRDGLQAFFDMRWGGAREDVSPADWEAYQQLASPESPAHLLARDDYYGAFTYAVFTGTVSA